MPSQSSPSHRTAVDGFSLPEVLVAMLIIGVLAAIAIPAFLSTTTKATDVQAKELARNAEATAEMISLDHGGSYAQVTQAELTAAEPTIPITASKQHAWLSSATPGESSYTVTATATNGDELTIARAADGTISRSCHSPKLKTGCSGAESSSW
jgi:prepilin-type N-terminal cleavage/methylation domain-containing protein